MDGIKFMYFVLIPGVYSVSPLNEPLQNHVKEEISDNLFLFLDQTLRGCTIKTLMHGTHAYSESIYSLLNYYNAGFTHSAKTYILEEYVAYTKPVLYVNEHGKYIVHSEYRRPEWLHKRHTSCYSHLYLVESSEDLQSAVRYHFVDLDLRRESPNYVIIWDMFDIRGSYQSMFSNQEFYGTFTDYRLVVRKPTKASAFDVSLVCIICGNHVPERLVSDPVTPSTQDNIKKLWKKIHGDHFGLKELACFACLKSSKKLISNYRVLPLEWLIASVTNITIIRQGIDLNYTSLSTFSHNHYIEPKNIQKYILDRRYPSFIMSSSHSATHEYTMFTVIHKSLLTPSGLAGLFAPLHTFAWLTIVTSGVSIFLILYIVENNMRYSSVLMSLFGPFTDHWIQCGAPQFNRIFLLWGFLSYSVTVLYGGGLASSLAVLKPPRYATRLNDLGDSKIQLISLSGIIYSGIDKSLSRFADHLSNQMSDWSRVQSGKNRAGQIEIHAKLMSEFQKGYCDANMRAFNRSNEDYPYSCLDKPYTMKHETPITFVDFGKLYLRERFVFQDSSTYWISPSIRVPDQYESFTLLLRKNYFAMLVLPIATSWVESGLQSISNRVRLHTSIKPTVSYPSVPSTFKIFEPEGVLRYTPWKLWSFSSVLALTAMLLSVALVVFQAERLSGLGIVCVTKHELRKHFPETTVVQLVSPETNTHVENGTS